MYKLTIIVDLNYCLIGHFATDASDVVIPPYKVEVR